MPWSSRPRGRRGSATGAGPSGPAGGALLWSEGLREIPVCFSVLGGGHGNLSMNPCPCGHLGDPRHACTCLSPLIERYRSRISGPLLDRIDLHVEMPALSLRELRAAPGEESAAVAPRIDAARVRQLARFGASSSTPVNAAMTPDHLRRHCRLDAAGQRLLDQAFERLGLSARALDRILKVARTLADLEGASDLRSAHVAEAIQYRALDRRFSG